MKYAVRHVTRYQYSEPVSHAQHELHLLPRETPHQHCIFAAIDISPRPNVRQERADYFGNRAMYVALAGVHSGLTVEATSELEVHTPLRSDPAEDMPWDAFTADLVRWTGDLQVHEMTFPSPYVPAAGFLADFARLSFPRHRPLLEGCLNLMSRIHAEFIYDPKATTIATPLIEVFSQRRGVCQDFAHLMIACLRTLGLPARYVSGYLVTTPPPGRPRLQGVDASHAWLSVFSPRLGFVDLDPTNNVVVGDQHVTVAFGRDFGDVTPMRGVIQGGGCHELQVAVDVTPCPR